MLRLEDHKHIEQVLVLFAIVVGRGMNIRIHTMVLSLSSLGEPIAIISDNQGRPMSRGGGQVVCIGPGMSPI